MNQNLSIRPYNPNFKAKFDPKFLEAAQKHYHNGGCQRKYKEFCTAVKRFEELPESDNIIIGYKEELKKGKLSHTLYTTETGKNSEVLLIKHGVLKKLLEKFTNLDEYVIKLKPSINKKG